MDTKHTYRQTEGPSEFLLRMTHLKIPTSSKSRIQYSRSEFYVRKKLNKLPIMVTQSSVADNQQILAN